METKATLTAPNMLIGAPWLIAHKSMLGVNQPRQVSLAGTDYVLWKDAKHQVHALPNTCPHMGAMLSVGWCVPQKDGSSKVVCPFHALEFDAQGCTVLPGTQKQTLPLLEPLPLTIQGDFIWAYGATPPQRPIPTILNEIAANYEFVGCAGDYSVPTDLLSMLLNMHDYNHQNGTHREMFRITEVQFQEFIDQGHVSHAYYDMPTAPYSLLEKLQKPEAFLLPKMIKAHLENHFPSLVIFYGESPTAKIAQCHLFYPEAEQRTHTYVLVFAQFVHPLFRFLGSTFLKLVDLVVKQDADILSKIHANTPQKIKLNNEVGMDWVRRNFASFPDVSSPNLSRHYSKEKIDDGAVMYTQGALNPHLPHV